MKKTLKVILTVDYMTDGRTTPEEEVSNVIAETVRPNLTSIFDGIEIQEVEVSGDFGTKKITV